LNGINSYTSKINLCEGYCEQYFYCNLEISSTLYIEVKPKREIESFVDYSDYYKRITSMLALLGANVSSKDRNFPYGLVTTISSGYDAPACAALAKMIGCDTSVSFNKPEKYDSDSGAEIATAIGYKNIIHHSALEYLKNDNLVEAEFCASGELGTGIVFQAFEKEFSSNLVFFGERGDKIWSDSWDDFNDEFRFSNEKFAGISFTENRLRVGYFICPLPLYGAQRWTSIYRISKSVEMKSYTIGGGYDRPIPRRILEEGGIARTLFGQRKIGAGINYRYDSRNRLRKRMSKDSYKSFISYVEQNRRKLSAKLWMQFITENRYIYIAYILKKFRVKMSLPKVNVSRMSNPSLASYLCLWGNAVLKERYLKALENEKE